MITPAISVLSAVEGLKIVEPSLDHLIVPITAVIIVVLFATQRLGTAAVGRAAENYGTSGRRRSEFPALKSEVGEARKRKSQQLAPPTNVPERSSLAPHISASA